MVKMVLISLFLLFFVSIKASAQKIDERLLVKEEAKLKALYFLDLIPEGQEKEYGFKTRNDFSKIKVEEPYQVYHLTLENNELAFVPIYVWRVPISVDNQYATLLTVQINEDKAEVVGLGGQVLAKKIQEFELLYPNTTSQRVMIRNTYLKRDYVTTNFTSLCRPNGPVNLISIDTDAVEPLYQVNEFVPIKTSVADFQKTTMEFIHNIK